MFFSEFSKGAPFLRFCSSARPALHLGCVSLERPFITGSRNKYYSIKVKAMSALSRFGPTLARWSFIHQQRHMASASAASDPVQRLFIEKIKEFKTSNKGLDEAHQRAMSEEMERLKRVYKVDDENKLGQLDHKFSSEADVSLRDLDESKDLREKIASGEIQKQLMADPKPVSALLASIPEQVTHDLHLPNLNKPDEQLLIEQHGVPSPAAIAAEMRPDYEIVGDPKMTPERLERELNFRFGDNMPTIQDDKKPERDVVNFPRQSQPLDAPPTRYHIIPESWFRFFYPKTGVTGPYTFAATVGTFLFSKEWLIMEHELLTGFTTTIIFTYAIIKYGPLVSGYLKKETKKECDDWELWRTGHIDFLDKLKTHYTNELQKKELIDELYSIRKQDVELQLEGEYRSRLQTVYEDTRRRLNYLVSVADSQRQIAHKNMVNWVISNAISSIGQKQEAEVLDNCILSLKQLASKNANLI